MDREPKEEPNETLDTIAYAFFFVSALYFVSILLMKLNV